MSCPYIIDIFRKFLRVRMPVYSAVFIMWNYWYTGWA